MASAERNPINQSARELGNGETLYTQYSSAAAVGRMFMVETVDHEQFGVFTYNLRTNQGRTFTNRQFRFIEDNDTLASILLDELTSQNLELIHPSGYPEVAALAYDIKNNVPGLRPTQLERGETYLHTSRNLLGSIDYKLFRFDSLEKREDGYGAPFTAVTYIPDGLAAGALSSVVFTSDQYQPCQGFDRGGLRAQMAAAIYSDNAAPYLTANHFRILPTQHEFRHIEREYVDTIVDLCEPEWPHFLEL